MVEALEGSVLGIWSSKTLRFTVGEIHNSNKETNSQSDFLYMNSSVKEAILFSSSKSLETPWRMFFCLPHPPAWSVRRHSAPHAWQSYPGCYWWPGGFLRSIVRLIQCSSIQFYLCSICYNCHCLSACYKTPAPDPCTSKSGKENLPFNREEPWAGPGRYGGTLLLMAR